MIRRLLPLLTLLALLAAESAPARQEEAPPCDLRQAHELYEKGRFEELLELLPACTGDGRLEADLRVEAQALLAKTLLALDEMERARAAVRELLARAPDFQPQASDPPRFVAEVREVRRQAPVTLVSSVSKSPESLREAPATVEVVTGEQIVRRGYRDLSEIFDDLPGFDVSRGSGDAHTLFYPRGYRSTNDRLLFLVDGVEENDLWSNVAYLSHQLSLGDVDRVEVVYGPASTLYGANAFAGVVNVITNTPEQILGEDGRNWAVRGEVGGGTFDTRWSEGTFAGRAPEGDLSWSLTARAFRSDEADLSGFEDWDYDPAVYDAVDYRAVLSLTDPAAAAAFVAGLSDEERALLDASPLFEVLRDGAAVTGVRLTAAGAEAARAFDRAAFLGEVGGAPVGYSDRIDDWLIQGRLQVGALTLGLRSWQREEGLTGWYTDRFYAGADNGSLWTPQYTSLYLHYGRRIGSRLGLTASSSFRRHVLDEEKSAEQQLLNYASGDLRQLELLRGVPSFFRRTTFDLRSDQFRSEVDLVWERSDRLQVVAGAEVRNGSIQGDFLLTVEPNPLDPDGRVDTEERFFDQTDAGAFVQASLEPSARLRLVAGGRVDHNEIRGAGGYGTVFNPRLAAIWTPGRWVAKAIYAEAFKDASNFNRFAIAPGFRDLDNPDLPPERVENLELSLGRTLGDFEWSLAAYQADYSDAVVQRQVPFQGGTTLRNQAAGELRIRGLQGTGRFRRDALELWGNYTYTDPESSNFLGRDGLERAVRVGDVARHRINLGGYYRWRERLGLSARLHWVGDRPTGPGTTVEANPFREIEGYTELDLALTWHRLVRDLDLQLAVDNVLDDLHYHPGTGAAAGDLASRLPQDGRSVFLRLIYGP